MHSEDLAMRTTNRIEAAVMVVVIGAIGLVSGSACCSCPLISAQMLVRGRVEADATITLGSFEVSAYTRTAGEWTGAGATGHSLSEQNFTWQDGTFQVHLGGGELGRCPNPFSSEVVVPEYPVPDKVHLVVTHDGCEQTFEIPVTADMLTDYDFPEYDIVQLTKPLVIGACPEE